MSSGKKNICIVLLVSVALLAKAQNGPKSLEYWLRSRTSVSKQGLKIFNGIDTTTFKKQYEANPKTWDKAFVFLTDTAKLKTIAPGQYAVDGDNAYAKISIGPSKPSQDVKWESHIKYIDLQYVISGAEQIEVANISALTLTEAYSVSTDAAHYSGTGEMYLADPAVFFLFFSTDAHRPGIQVNGPVIEKKLVIKIAYVQ